MIRRVLVANRGEIARRVFSTCRRLGIATAAVYSEPDAGAPFVREADVAVALGGATPAESYLRGDAVIEAAKRCGADAIHPGYGFLAENAAFAQAVIDAGLTWIGPSPEAIAAMGSKTEARDRMERAGVPVLPGRHLSAPRLPSASSPPSPSASAAPPSSASSPPDPSASAPPDPSGLEEAGQEVGFPLLVKASAGGGGKGMRLVESPGDLAAAVESARREAASAFGDDTVFLERFAPRARHVEIQIVGDTHGRVIALHERDCSVQRRHQKVIEEAPSPAVDADLRARMSEAAVAAGEALRYVGAGTVEFLLTAEGEFFFLEVNTRLQVEHPVTELVCGVDLLELQLRVAEGGALPDPPQLNGHAIEARLYAEDAANDFLPQTGTLTRFRLGEGVRVDTGVEDGSVISPYYDPMIAKVVAHGATRAEAARRLADALARAELHGTVTNRDFLVRVLRHEEFLGGAADTSFLERHDPAELAAPLVGEDARRLAAAAAALAGQAARRAGATAQASLPSGWRNVPSQLQRVAFEGVEVGYRFARDGSLAVLEIDGERVDDARLHACTPDEVDLEVGGVRRRYRIATAPSGSSSPAGSVAWWVNTDEGQADLAEQPRFTDPSAAAQAGSLASPMPGSVVRVLVEEGADVSAGQPLLVLEAMKMEHEIVAPADGTLAELRVGEGTQVEAGAVLAVVQGDE